MCYRRCRWENRDGECRYRGAVAPCERTDKDDDDDATPDWWDGDDDEYEGRDPDMLYDEYVERHRED